MPGPKCFESTIELVLEKSVMAEPTFDHERRDRYRFSIEYEDRDAENEHESGYGCRCTDVRERGGENVGAPVCADLARRGRVRCSVFR